MNIFDLETKKSDEGAVLQLVHPDTMEPIEGATITLLGRDSAVARKIALRRQQAAINRAMKGRKAATIDPEELEKQGIEDLTELTVSWTLQGPKGYLPNTKDEFMTVYSNPRLAWIKAQALAFVDETSNFLDRSLTA